jgi:hypothetical protein
VVQEGLQNADDAGGSTFAIMLDLRQHDAGGLREEGLVRCQGESMLLFDDAGFSDKDWKSLRNLHQSEKRKSPWTTGETHRVLVAQTKWMLTISVAANCYV